MPYPTAQQFREDQDEINRMIEKFDLYFKRLTEHDPNKTLEITLKAYHLKYALEWFRFTHGIFEDYQMTETILP